MSEKPKKQTQACSVIGLLIARILNVFLMRLQARQQPLADIGGPQRVGDSSRRGQRRSVVFRGLVGRSYCSIWG